jgi:hypothetical protein
MQSTLDAVRERMRVAVELAARDQHDRQHRQEEIRADKHRSFHGSAG